MRRILGRLLADVPYGCWALPVLSAGSLALAVMVRFVPLPRVVKILGRLPSLPVIPGSTSVQRQVSVVDLATRLLQGEGRCLIRSLLLCWLMGSRGESVEILVGVCREAGTFRSHAWIEAGGRVLGESPGTAERFGTILRLSVP
jgi:hypothetical protein